MDLNQLSNFVIPREQWFNGTTADYPTAPGRTPLSIVGVDYHHTVTDLEDDNDLDEIYDVDKPAAQILNEIWYFHVMIKGWSDIFYNLLIDARDGLIYAGRPALRYSQSDLKAWLTVATIGDLRDDPILPHLLRSAYNIELTVTGSANIRGHKERASTACPALFMEKYVIPRRGGWIPIGGDMAHQFRYMAGGGAIDWLEVGATISAISEAMADQHQSTIARTVLTVEQVKGLRTRWASHGILDESTASDVWLNRFPKPNTLGPDKGKDWTGQPLTQVIESGLTDADVARIARAVEAQRGK